MDIESKLKDFKLTGVTVDGEELGHGAYTTVIKLQFHGLKCAGKRFHRSLYTCHNDVQRIALQQRWHKECTVLSKLRHPNIVQFLGILFEGDDTLPMLVMEFVPFTLSGHLEKHGTFPPEVSYGILVDVAKALCYLHGGNPVIIHRDLTANNVRLTSEMRAKISDLGTAKILEIMPARKVNMAMCPGTLCYMPPEALTSNPMYSREIDCFSFGVLMLHTFCGQWPFPDEHNTVGADGKITGHTEVERRRRYFTRCGEDHPLRSLIHTCLSDVCSDRPDATEILQSVQTVAKQHPLQFESTFVLLQEIDMLTQRLQEANSRASKQHKEHYDQLAMATNEYNQQVIELLQETELILNEAKSETDNKTAEDAVQQMPMEDRNGHDIRSLSLMKSRRRLQSEISEANLGRSIDLCVLRSHLSLLVADRAQLASALRSERANTEMQVSRLEKIIDMKCQVQDSTSARLESKNKELEVKDKQIDVLQAANRMRDEEIKSKNCELKLKDEENQAIEKQVEAMQLLLETQEKRVNATTKLLEEKEKQLTAANTHIELIKEQAETIQKELKLQLEQSEANEESLLETAARQASIFDTTKLEMDFMQNSEIPDLRSQLDAKDKIVQELLEQHKRAQELLTKVVCFMSPPKFFVFNVFAPLYVANSNQMQCTVQV